MFSVRITSQMTLLLILIGDLRTNVGDEQILLKLLRSLSSFC